MQNGNRRSNQILAHRTELAMALGCTVCPDLGLCGGIKPEASLYNCLDLCQCKTDSQKAACQIVCPRKPKEYARRVREVDGFRFSTIGSLPQLPHYKWPPIVPWIDGRSCLAGPLPLDAAAVPLRRLFRARTGSAVDPSPEALAFRFAILPTTALLITGVSFEEPIERFWSVARAGTFLEELAAIQPRLVTTPNFSLFSDTPRDDNMYNMKRIAICWHDFVSRGIPTALHLNARTDRDWQRWNEFLTAHTEIATVAFEFVTGTAPLKRARWYLRNLIALADDIKRPLQLVMRGGWSFLQVLRAHFREVVFIATDPLMRARKRRRLIIQPGAKPVWRRVPYIRGEKLDGLFLENLAAFNHLLPNR